MNRIYQGIEYINERKTFIAKTYSVYVAVVALMGLINYATLYESSLEIHSISKMAENRTVIDEGLDGSCTIDSQCGHGACEIEKDVNNNPLYTKCVCDEGYITVDNIANLPDKYIGTCNYEQISILAAFLISLLIGGCGVDWCFLARGTGCYICLGILKACTLGGLGIWAIVDWIRVLAGTFPDGFGQELCDWDC